MQSPGSNRRNPRQWHVCLLITEIGVGFRQSLHGTVGQELIRELINAVRASKPELAETAKGWRSALCKMRNIRGLSVLQLREQLKTVGVEREAQTLEGWLDLNRASPIAPRGQRAELSALWPLIEKFSQYSIEEVANACARLRTLRAASGRALLKVWKGEKTVGLDIDEVWLRELVDRLRQEVQVYEVAAITLGHVPAAVLGWWLPSALVEAYNSGVETSDLPVEEFSVVEPSDMPVEEDRTPGN